MGPVSQNVHNTPLITVLSLKLSHGSVQHGTLMADRAAALLVGYTSVCHASELHITAVHAGVD